MFDPHNPFHREKDSINNQSNFLSPPGLPKSESLASKKEPEPQKKEEQMFGGEGLSRSQFKEVLKKKLTKFGTKLNENDRLKIEKEMERQKYGEKIDMKDLKKRAEKLKKPRSLSPDYQDRLRFGHEIDALKALEKMKKNGSST